MHGAVTEIGSDVTAASFNHFVVVSNVLFTFRCVVQTVHLRRFAMATLMMSVVAGSGLVCMYSSSDSKEMANSKCALAYEDRKVCIMHPERVSPLILVAVLRAGFCNDCDMSEILNGHLQGAIQLLSNLTHTKNNCVPAGSSQRAQREVH